MSFFLLLDTEDIFKNAGNQTAIDLHCMFSILRKSMATVNLNCPFILLSENPNMSNIFKNLFLIEGLWNQVKFLQVVIRFAKVINLIVQC